MRKLLGVTLLCLASSAMASDWVKLPVVKDGPPVSSYDRESLKKRGTTVEFWIKTSWHEPREFSNIAYDSIEAQWQIDCEADTFASRAMTYKLKGQVMGSSADPYYFRPIPPDTWAQAIERTVCR